MVSNNVYQSIIFTPISENLKTIPYPLTTIGISLLFLPLLLSVCMFVPIRYELS